MYYFLKTHYFKYKYTLAHSKQKAINKKASEQKTINKKANKLMPKRELKMSALRRLLSNSLLINGLSNSLPFVMIVPNVITKGTSLC